VGCAGLGEVEATQLRAIVEQAAALLAQRWAWGEAHDADLVLADPGTEAALRVVADARERGAQVVAVVDPSRSGPPSDPTLERPLQLDAVLRLLDRHDADAGATFTHEYVARADATDLSAFFGAELLSAIPDSRTAQQQPVPNDAGQEAAEHHEPAAAPAAATPAPATPPAPEPVRAAPLAERAAYPLADYLSSALIGLPSRIALPGAPALVIDPQARSYHSTGDLAALEPYLQQRIPRTDWTALLPSMLKAVRAEVPARSFDLLLWYVALRGTERLAPHLDPGGTYRLKRALDLSRDHPRGAKVAAAMAVPRALHEIATLSATSVVEVYRIVSAFDAIGYLEWQPRARVRTPDTSGSKLPARRPGVTR
jgi:hypothetical protein